MKKVFSIVFLLFFGLTFAQQNLVSTHSFFRDQLFAGRKDSAGGKSNLYNGNSFLPINENRYNLPRYLKDTSIQYYDFSEIIYKKHLIELKGKDCFLSVSPLLDLTIGRDLKDSTKVNLFQNTRGILIEGDLFKNFSFSTSLYENQSRISSYEKSFVTNHGEFYTYWYGYGQQNAVIPGGTRTKPFKTSGFDYAYAIGNIIYSPHRKIDLIAGNNQQFIGSGYRSMLLSDNSSYSPYFRIDYFISKRFSFNYLRSRNMNLVRKKTYSTVEGYYQPKGLAVNYFSFKASEKINISLFEGSVWSMGDSLHTKPVNPIFYNPIPFVSSFLQDSLNYSIQGMNVNWILKNNLRVYGQFALGKLDFNQTAVQIGMRFFNLFKLKNSQLQTEYNFASKNMYQSPFSRLNYSNYNLPLAHTKGNAFHEFVLRFNIEINRCYLDLKSITYYLKDFNPNNLLPVIKISDLKTGMILHNQLELGYRMNKKINLNFFANAVFRKDLIYNQINFVVSAGIRTALISHYNDY
jgi:hypothetical protein